MLYVIGRETLSGDLVSEETTTVPLVWLLGNGNKYYTGYASTPRFEPTPHWWEASALILRSNVELQRKQCQRLNVATLK